MSNNLMNENFYEYLNKKYIKINQKIDKKKMKISRKMQSGGGDYTLSKLQLDLAQLEVIKDIIKKKIDIGDKIDFDLIQEPVKKLVKELGEFANSMNLKAETSTIGNPQLILNELSQINTMINDSKEAYLDIKVERIPKIIHPPINIPSIGEGHKKILEWIDTSINELLNEIKSKDAKDAGEFEIKLTEIIKAIEELEVNMKTMTETSQLIKSRIDEMDKYTNIDLKTVPNGKIDEYMNFLGQSQLAATSATMSAPATATMSAAPAIATIPLSELESKEQDKELNFNEIDIRPDFFIQATDTMSELIEIKKLDETEIIPQKGQLAVKTEIKFDKVFENIKITDKTLVSPDFLKINKGDLTGGNSIYLYNREDIMKVMNVLFLKWQKELESIKMKNPELFIKALEKIKYDNIAVIESTKNQLSHGFNLKLNQLKETLGPDTLSKNISLFMKDSTNYFQEIIGELLCNWNRYTEKNKYKIEEFTDISNFKITNNGNIEKTLANLLLMLNDISTKINVKNIDAIKAEFNHGVEKIFSDLSNSWKQVIDNIHDIKNEGLLDKLTESIKQVKAEKLKLLSDNIYNLSEITTQIKSFNTEFDKKNKYNCLESNSKFKEIVVDIDALVQNINIFIGGLGAKFIEIEQNMANPGSSLLLVKLSGQIDYINKIINEKIRDTKNKIDLYYNFPKEIEPKCNKAMVEKKINDGIDFIINLSFVKSSQFKKLILQKMIFEYYLINAGIEKDLLMLLKEPTEIEKNLETMIKKINDMSYKDKLNFIISFLDKSITSNKSKELVALEKKERFKMPDLTIGNLITKLITNLKNDELTEKITGFVGLKYSKKQEFEHNLSDKNNELKKIRTLNEKLKPLEGGFINQWEKYYYKIIDIYMKINEYKKLYENFKKTSRDFNIKYIQLFNHQLYITNYIQLVLFNDNYKIYQYLSKGTVNYYRSIVEKIYNECNNDKIVKSNNVINYFYKYHYITLQLLLSFLTQLRNNWSVDINYYKTPESEVSKQTQLAEKSKNTCKLEVIPTDKMHTDKMKKGLFIFNLFKDILDAYANNLASPIAVYLRINDFSGKVGNSILEVFKKIENQDKLDIGQLRLCDKYDNAVIKATSKTDLDNLDKILNDFSKIEFNEIYDSKGFSDNATLAMYMNIPTYLGKGKSIMMITYGYSGIGKTFTLFGKVNGDGSVENGILQKSLLSIQNTQGIYMRTYEIYGKALPYKSYWSNLTTDKYDHQIYSYSYDEDKTIQFDVITNEKMVPYLNKIKDNNIDKYREISIQEINSFETFINGIDDIRKKDGRIKKTVNNPDSSRSIMVYEFKIKLEGEKYVRFVVMDLPGKEDIKSAYVYPAKPEQELKEAYCININKEILKDSYTNAAGTTVDFTYNEAAVKAAIFLNPIFISVFPTIANKVNDYFIKKFKKDDDFNKFKVTTLFKKDRDKPLYTVKKADLQIFYQKINSSDDFGISSTTSRNDKKSSDEVKEEHEDTINYEPKFRNCVVASEIMRYLLEKNKLSDIIEFYNDELLDISPECKKKKSAGLPFEGFYINENILGLVNQLRKRLNPLFTIDKKNLMGNYFSERMGERKVHDPDFGGDPAKSNLNIYENEGVAQTYFIRNFLREKITDNPKRLLISNDGNHLLNADDLTTVDTNYGKQSIKSWFEDAYDFNKSYTEKPPIQVFMEAYFSALDEKEPLNKTIDNFYLFYVVNNENLGKCANQIKLIHDSKEFISSIKNYTAPEIAPVAVAASVAASVAVAAPAP